MNKPNKYSHLLNSIGAAAYCGLSKQAFHYWKKSKQEPHIAITIAGTDYYDTVKLDKWKENKPCI